MLTKGKKALLNKTIKKKNEQLERKEDLAGILKRPNQIGACLENWNVGKWAASKMRNQLLEHWL